MMTGFHLSLLPAQYVQYRVIKGIPKKRMGWRGMEFDTKVGVPIEVGLKKYLNLGDLDARLVVTETRRTSRSIYYSAYHPDWGSFEIRRAL